MRSLSLLPFLLFTVTLVATVTAALLTRSSFEEAAQARLEQFADNATERLMDRLEIAGSIARGTAGLFAAEERVSSPAFHAFVGSQSMTRWFPHGRVFWVAAPRPGEQDQVLARGRREAPGFRFRPADPRYPVLFVSPQSELNERVLGLDLALNDARREAIERARDDGELVLISDFTLEPGWPSAAVLSPAYTGAADTLEERRAHFRGVVIVSAASDDLLEAAFTTADAAAEVELEDLTGGRPLWSTPDFPTTQTGVQRQVNFGGRELSVHLVPRAGAHDDAQRFTFIAILVVGTLLAFAFAGLTLQQLRARRAAELAQCESRAAFDEADRRRALLDLVVEQSSDGIMMADHHGTLRLFNQAAAELHGVRREEVLSSGWRQTWALTTLEGQPLPADQTALSRALGGELIRGERWMVHRPDGETRVLSGTASPLKNPDGTTAGAVLVIRDETERLRAEAEQQRLIVALEFSNAELEQFASVASHDLKAPLRGISQLAQWLEEDLGSKLSPEDHQHLELLKGRVRRLLGLIDGILGYARAGQSSMTLEHFDARDAAAEALVLLAPPPGSDVELPAPGLRIEGDKALLLQVLMNLLSNAFTHGARSAAKIEVRAEQEGAFVRFAIKDNGPGIPPEYHQRIWGMFQTLVPRDEKESTGIGLAVVRKVVQAQGGRVWLESAEGEGATFFFTWPLQPRRGRS